MAAKTRTMTPGMTSSLTDEWATPGYVFEPLNLEFGFTLDVCADESNHKVYKFFSKKEDGLKQDWTKDVCWMNPPYGRSIGKWIKKAVETARGGGIVVALLPARTDTRWWRDVMQASELRFISGRVRFGDANTGAPFPSVIAVFGTPTVPAVSLIRFDDKGEYA